jgi:hypothetical protein
MDKNEYSRYQGKPLMIFEYSKRFSPRGTIENILENYHVLERNLLNFIDSLAEILVPICPLF